MAHLTLSSMRRARVAACGVTLLVALVCALAAPVGGAVAAAAPPNDAFADAEVINGSGAATLTMIGASIEAGTPAPTYPADVWFKYQSPLGGVVTFSGDATDIAASSGVVFGTVYTGASLSTLKSLGSFERYADRLAALPGSVTVTVQAGRTYYVRAATLTVAFPLAGGRLTWSFVPDFNLRGGRFGAIDPLRAVDTRSGARVQPGDVLTVPIGGRAGVPVTGAVAAVVNLTAVDATAAGFLTATATAVPGAVPTTSNVNFAPGGPVANLAVVPLSGTGAIAVVVSAPVHVLVDVLGWIGDSATGGVVPQTPARALDTRQRSVGRARAGEVIELEVGAPGAVEAVALTLTAADALADGYVTAYPDAASVPATSNVNFRTGATVANLAFVKVGADGRVRLRASASVHLIADVAALVTPGTGLRLEMGEARRALDERAVTFTNFVNGPRTMIAAGVNGVPADAKALLANVTVARHNYFAAAPNPFIGEFPAVPGYLQVYPSDVASVATSNLNFRPGADVADLVVVPIGADGAIRVATSANAVVVIDVLGWYR